MLRSPGVPHRAGGRDCSLILTLGPYRDRRGAIPPTPSALRRRGWGQPRYKCRRGVIRPAPSARVRPAAQPQTTSAGEAFARSCAAPTGSKAASGSCSTNFRVNGSGGFNTRSSRGANLRFRGPRLFAMKNHGPPQRATGLQLAPPFPSARSPKSPTPCLSRPLQRDSEKRQNFG
jgi:hypothetical protein